MRGMGAPGRRCDGGGGGMALTDTTWSLGDGSNERVAKLVGGIDPVVGCVSLVPIGALNVAVAARFGELAREIGFSDKDVEDSARSAAGDGGRKFVGVLR